MKEQLTSKPQLADFMAKWSRVNVVAHEQERSAREEHAQAVIAWQAAEIERLNNWADGFSDAQLKERQTGEAYQRELRAEIERLRSRVEIEAKAGQDLRRERDGLLTLVRKALFAWEGTGPPLVLDELRKALAGAADETMATPGAKLMGEASSWTEASRPPELPPGVTPAPRGVGNEFDAIKAAIHADPEYGWSWHCNVAMSIMDAGVGIAHRQANEAAAQVMQHLFRFDPRQCKEWQWERVAENGG